MFAQEWRRKHRLSDKSQTEYRRTGVANQTVPMSLMQADSTGRSISILPALIIGITAVYFCKMMNHSDVQLVYFHLQHSRSTFKKNMADLSFFALRSVKGQSEQDKTAFRRAGLVNSTKTDESLAVLPVKSTEHIQYTNYRQQKIFTGRISFP